MGSFLESSGKGWIVEFPEQPDQDDAVAESACGVRFSRKLKQSIKRRYVSIACRVR